MNKAQKELLDKCIEVEMGDKLPPFKGIYIIQQRKLHESGYRQMYVIGQTEREKDAKDSKYYLIGTYSDVIDFQPVWEKYLHNDSGLGVCDLHLDIDRNGIIHIWTNGKKKLVCNTPYVSNCILEVID